MFCCRHVSTTYPGWRVSSAGHVYRMSLSSVCLLLQASSDFFGDQMKSAANQRAKAIAAAEDAGADDAIDADASADAENGETHRLWYLWNR